jgi:hypothetical protein
MNIFIKDIYSKFKEYFVEMKKNKSTDIVSFIDLIFNLKNNNGMLLRENIIDKLSTFKTSASYIPKNNGEKVMLGLLLNFAIKYQNLDKKSVVYLYEVLNKIKKLYLSKRHSGSNIENGEMILLGFDEFNWSSIQETMEKKKDWESIFNAMNIKDVLKSMKIKNENQLRFSDVTSIDNAQKIFMKEKSKKEITTKIINLELVDEII